MMALITAAGQGKRLGKISENTNKCLLRIAGRSLMGRSLSNLRLNNLPKPVVVTGHAASRVKEEFNGRAEFTYNPHYDKSGLLVSLWTAKDKLKKNGFVILMGDILYDAKILQRCLQASGDIVVCVRERTHAGERIDSKVIVHGHRIVGMGKNLPEELATGEFVGIVKISRKRHRKFFDGVEQVLMAGNPVGFLMDTLMRLQAQGEQLKVVYTGKDLCMEVDTSEELKRAEGLLAEHRLPCRFNDSLSFDAGHHETGQATHHKN